jgi:DNA-binding NarL/FixJ family response regulator
MSQIRILLADDHVLTREGLRRFLDAGRDFAVIGETGDGQEAVRLAQELRPDIVLLSITVAGLNAVKVAQALKTARPKTRIVVVAHSGDSEELIRALLHLGVRGYLGKTASLAELNRALRAVTAGQVYVQPAARAPLYASAWQGTTVR